MLQLLGCKTRKAGHCGSLYGAGKGSIPITRSRQPRKSPVITDGAFSFLAFEGLDRKGLAGKDGALRSNRKGAGEENKSVPFFRLFPKHLS